MDLGLKGRNAIVTGATRGIGCWSSIQSGVMCRWWLLVKAPEVPDRLIIH